MYQEQHVFRNWGGDRRNTNNKGGGTMFNFKAKISPYCCMFGMQQVRTAVLLLFQSRLSLSPLTSLCSAQNSHETSSKTRAFAPRFHAARNRWGWQRVNCNFAIDFLALELMSCLTYASCHCTPEAPFSFSANLSTIFR